MNIGEPVKTITRPDAIPIKLPKRRRTKRQKEQPIPIGIPVEWPVRIINPVEVPKQ